MVDVHAVAKHARGRLDGLDCAEHEVRELALPLFATELVEVELLCHDLLDVSARVLPQTLHRVFVEVRREEPRVGCLAPHRVGALSPVLVTELLVHVGELPRALSV